MAIVQMASPNQSVHCIRGSLGSSMSSIFQKEAHRGIEPLPSEYKTEIIAIRPMSRAVLYT